MKKLYLVYILIIIASSIFPQTAKQIVDRADQALVGNKVYSISRITVYKSGEPQPVQEIESFTMEKNDKSFSLSIYTAPRRMRGMANLMIEDDLWVRFSSTGRVRKLSSSAKKNSAGGSDFSYADMGDSGQGLSDRYNAVLIGDQVVAGESCYKIELNRDKKDTPYEKMIVYITKDRFRYIKIDYYESGANIKSLELYDYRTVKNMDYPFAYTMKNHTKPSETRVTVELFEVDSKKVKERFFSTGYLESIR